MFPRFDILKDSPERVLLLLAFPIIILNILKAGYNIVDLFWLGQLGKDYLSGVSAAIFLVWAIHSLSALVTVGLVAVVSRNIGEKLLENARRNTLYSLKLALFSGILVGMLFYPIIDVVIGVMDLEPAVAKAGTEYLAVMVLGTPLIFLMFALHSAMIAWGDTVTPVKIYAVTFVLNIVLSPLMMFGVFPFPRMETKGAAYATLIAYGVSSILFIRILVKRKWIEKNLFASEINRKINWLYYFKIGYPGALTGMFFSFIYFFLAKTGAKFGSDVVGAMGIGHKVESLSYFLSMGAASALATFTGQNLGAGNKERVLAGTRFSLKYLAIFTLIYSLVIIIFAPQIAGLFNNSDGIVFHGTRYLRIVFLAETLQSVLILLEDGAFAGAGYTKPTFKYSFTITLLRVPFAWILAVTLGFGANGIWLTIMAAMTINALIFIYLYKKEEWLSVELGRLL